MENITTKEFVRSILLRESSELRDQIREVFSRYISEHSNASMTLKMSVGMLLLNELSSKDRIVTGFSKILAEKFESVLRIVMEHGLKLPEEEVELENCVKAIYEEGEGGAPAPTASAPTNVVAGIEPGTPRIKKKKVDDV